MESTFNVHLRLPPMPRYARAVRSALAAFAQHHHVERTDVENLTFAVGEALANAIAHSKSHDDIDVAIRIDDEAIVATVRDQGMGLSDDAGLERRTVPLPLDSAEAGRGFAIMQRCTDIFDVRSSPGEGTLVTLGRYRNKAEERSSAR